MSHLVYAVAAAQDANAEEDWLEWKSELDLSTAAGRFELAKEVLAKANRPVIRSLANCLGWSYVLVGVSEKGIQGTREWPTATLEQKLGQYLGQGTDAPAWRPVNVGVGGEVVLAIEIAPPQDGDPIYTLRKSFESFKEGTVFVAGVEKAEQASPDDMRMLQQRLLAGTFEDRVMERVALACTTLQAAVEFGVAFPMYRAFGTVTGTEHEDGPWITSWLHVVPGGSFEESLPALFYLTNMPTQNMIAVFPSWVDWNGAEGQVQSAVDKALAAIEGVTRPDTHQQQTHLILICTEEFGHIHSAIRWSIAAGPDGLIPLRVGVPCVRFSV
ncbi:hypothetical protein AZH51_15395 [Branchiibius sp. NY16-3462-2]|nr:hypothetical protein AZH51_15395 [Branchiibius sp. NY16-3462-2]